MTLARKYLISPESWSEKQVLSYWSELCQPKFICQKFIKNEPQPKTELEMVYLQTDIYRKRLALYEITQNFG